MTFEMFVKEKERKAKQETIIQLFAENLLTEETAAEKLNVSLDEFHSMLEEYLTPAE